MAGASCAGAYEIPRDYERVAGADSHNSPGAQRGVGSCQNKSGARPAEK